jgi:hypothetical protein
MSRQKLVAADFDPFYFSHLFRRRKHTPNYRLWLVGLLAVVPLIVVNVAQRTIGAPRHFQLVDDLGRITGLGTVPPAVPEFPLLRDVTSWLLLLAVISGAVLLHKQWQLMSICLGQLVENGALVPKKEVHTGPADAPVLDARRTFGLNGFTRVLGIDRIIAGCTVEDALSTLVNTVNQRMRTIRSVSFLTLLLLAFILSGLLIQGEKHGLFTTVAPRDLSGAEFDHWLAEAYQSWWAGENHLAGHYLYWLYAVFAIFVILQYHVVGLVTIYLTIGLRFVCRPSADWLNRDGRYGWTPLGRVFRTVLFATTLLGLGLTITLAVLGLGNFPWVGALVVLYLVVVPVFILVPPIVFRKAEATAKDDRIADLLDVIEKRKIDILEDVEATTPFVAEIERCRTAKIRPLRLRTASSSFLILVLLPIILAAVQTFFPWLLGSG